MRILFDHQAFTIQKFGGISRYYCELINQLEKDDSINLELSILLSENENLKIIKNYKKRNFLENLDFRGKYRMVNFLNEQYTIRSIQAQKYEIFHPTYYNPYFIQYFKKKPFVITIYDLIHEKFKERFSDLAADNGDALNKKLLLNLSSRIISISESTKKDIVEIYDIHPDKITVVPLSHSSFDSRIEPVTSNFSFDINLKYLLFVGNRNSYKNFVYFLESIKDLLRESLDCLLICAGGPKFSLEEKALIERHKLSNYVFHEKIDDGKLEYLYTHAIAFVFPSLYEGFGIPVLEAMNCNCPCILSDRGSLPEVAGEAAIYFNPENSSSILSTVNKVLESSTLRDQLKSLGKERLKKFSWKSTAEQTKRVYQSILN